MVYHYAPWAYLPAIVQHGALRPSNARADGEVPLLWFSLNQHWEPTATKVWENKAGTILQMTFRQQVSQVGCIRFGLDDQDPRLLDWKQACKAAGTGRNERRAMENAGKKLGAKPEDWFATLMSVQLADLRFQVFLNEQWLDAEPAEMAEVWTQHMRKKLLTDSLPLSEADRPALDNVQ